MKNQITKIIVILAAIVCFSVTASAQKDKDKRGDKRKPPVIVPDKDRQPKKDKPKDKKDKKPTLVAKLIQARAGVKI